MLEEEGNLLRDIEALSLKPDLGSACKRLHAREKLQKVKRMLKMNGNLIRDLEARSVQSSLASDAIQKVYDGIRFHGIHWKGDDTFAKEDTEALARGLQRFLHAKIEQHVLSEQTTASQIQDIVHAILDKHHSDSNELLIISYAGHGGIKHGQPVISRTAT